MKAESLPDGRQGDLMKRFAMALFILSLAVPSWAGPFTGKTDEEIVSAIDATV